MKTKYYLTLLIILAVNLFAQDKKYEPNENKKPKNDNYCALRKDDGLIVISNAGREILADVTLNNGTIIRIDGTVIKNNGEKIVLKDGDCIDPEGNMFKQKNDIIKKDNLPPD